MKNQNIRFIAEAAVMIAASVVLSFIKVFDAPFGGTVTLASVLPLCIISYRYGFIKGLMTSFTASLIFLILGFNNLSYGTSFASVVSILLFDYIVAYSAYSLAFVFRKFGKSRMSNAVSFSFGVVLASLVRFLCHWITGAVVWYSLTKAWYENDTSYFVFKYGPWSYSFIYNISYFLPDMIIAIIAGIGLSLVIDFKSEKLIYRN